MDMGTPKQQVVVWIIILLLIFFAGWLVASFVAWDFNWPLASTGSRVWFLFSALATFSFWKKARDDE